MQRIKINLKEEQQNIEYIASLMKDIINKDEEYVKRKEIQDLLLRYAEIGLRGNIKNEFNKKETSEETRKSEKDFFEGIRALKPETLGKCNWRLPRKIALLKIYFNDNLNLLQYNEKDGKLTFQGEKIIDVKKDILSSIDISEIKDGKYIVEGYHFLEGFSLFGLSGNLVFQDERGNIFEPEESLWPIQNRTDWNGENVLEVKKFRFNLPGEGRYSLKAEINGKLISLTPIFGNFSRVSKKYGSYFSENGYIVSYSKGEFNVEKNSFFKTFKYELKFDLGVLKNKRPDVILKRWLYFWNKLFQRKPLWIFRDNEDRAKDSAREMFKYFSNHGYSKKYNSYFILDKKSEDYEEIRKYGKVLQPYTLKYYIKILQADIFIDTRGSLNPKYIFQNDSKFFKDLCHWKYVWIIHGVMVRNNHTWTNKFVINGKVVVNCSKMENESMSDPKAGYGYDHGEAVLTGLPRHDALERKDKKHIVIMPTWRKNIAGKLIPGTSERQHVSNFKETDFFKFYNNLINDPRLLKVIKENGYTGTFYLHPVFIKQADDFKGNDIIKVAKSAADSAKVVNGCSLMISDYSSVASDAAYINIPVLYLQYDIESFGDIHTGKDGDFDYVKDGFGKVCTDYESSINEIIKLIESGCQQEEIYKERADKFFAYKDKNNCKRVFDAIEKL